MIGGIFLTAMEFLEQAYKLKCEIELDELRLAAMRSAVYGSSVNYEYAGNKTGQRYGFQNAIANITMLEADIDNEKYKLTLKSQEIKQVINKIPSLRHRQVLERRYLGFQDFKIIAVEMNYAIKNIYKIHKEGLKKIETICDKID